MIRFNGKNIMLGNSKLIQIGYKTIFSRRLPKEYQEVEYITCTGGQYINTGLSNYKNTWKYYAVVRLKNTSERLNVLMGKWGKNTGDYVKIHAAVGAGTTTPTLTVQSGWYEIITLDNTDFHSILLESDGYSLDGVKTTETAVTEITINEDLYFMNGVYYSSSSPFTFYGFMGDVKEFMVYDENNTLLRWFIPCFRLSDNAIGMYDMANSGKNLLPTNNGTTTLSTGTISCVNGIVTINVTKASSSEYYKITGTPKLATNISGTGSTDATFLRKNKTYIIQDYGTHSVNFSIYIGRSVWRSNKKITLNDAFTSNYDYNAIWVYFDSNVPIGTTINETFKLMVVEGETSPTTYENPPFYSSVSGYDFLTKGSSVFKRHLPKEYQRVEYLRSDGNCYIDTGIYPDYENTKIVFDGFEPTAKSLFGSSSTKFGATGSSGSIRFDYNGSNYSSGVAFTERHKWCLDGNKAYVDGVLKNTFTQATGTDTITLKLFARSGGTDDASKGTCYNTQIYNNGALIRNLIPCYRKSDNVAGMYDLAWKSNYQGSSVDLGTLTWTNRESVSTGLFCCQVNNIKTGVQNVYVAGWGNGTYSGSLTDNQICQHDSAVLVYFKKLEWVGKTANEVKALMSGTKLYYQSTTDTGWSRPFYTNAGTGEFLLPSMYTITPTTTNVTASSSNPTIITTGTTAVLTFTADGTSYKVPTNMPTITGATGTYNRISDTQCTIILSNPTSDVSFSVVGEAISTGETWVINEEPNGYCPEANISFVSNGITFSYFQGLSGRPAIAGLYYYYESEQFSSGIHVYSNATTIWEDEAYRTITFSTSPTGDLLTWLQANATKQ